ncbi:MAG: hypothetical protein AB1650_09600 [Candidatus Omnitrophota bacterium]
MHEGDIQKLEEIVSLMVKDKGLELFDISVRFQRGTADIELLIDHVSGGITIGECAAVNEQIVNEIDSLMLFNDNYTLSVSSPGIDRPLKEPKDFRRVVGQDIAVTVKDAEGNISTMKGRIEGVDDEAVILKNDEGEAGLLLRHIVQAEVLL